MCLLDVVVLQSLRSTELEHLVSAMASILPHTEDMFALLSYQMPTRNKCHFKQNMCMRERKTARANHRKWEAGFVDSCPEILLKHTTERMCAWNRKNLLWHRKSFKIFLVYLSIMSVKSLQLSELLFEDKLNQKCNFCHHLLTVMLFQIYVIDFGSILEESLAYFSI